MKPKFQKSMLMAGVLSFFLLVSESSFAQAKEEGTLIRVTGMVVDESTKTPLRARVFYEKLPYYDDMGTASTNEKNGVYELYMLENVKYIINVKADGYLIISEEIEVTDNGTQLIEKNFRMVLDGDHEMFNLQDLLFARGKAVIDATSYKELDDFSIWLDERPDVTIQLEGHTDFQGNAQANVQLSQDRVDAVQNYLIKNGIKKSRIKTKAYGGTQPITRERTPEARTSNRRVEVRILQQ